ncbi:hypothetical protein [Sphingorhabdus sp.]|uniref:hypothetical protein n=1 Tax=Sphingorhabdus sp. TaxID=1902408 RepID=UPI0033419B44
MSPQHVLAQLGDLNPEAVLFDNMSNALIGLGYIGNADPVAVYSKTKLYEQLLADGLSQEDAEEYYSGRFVRHCVGALTPVIVDDTEKD